MLRRFLELLRSDEQRSSTISSIVRPVVAPEIQQAAAPLPPAEKAPWSPVGADKFEFRSPASQNAADIFKGHWAGDLGAFGVKDSGPTPLFTLDDRPRVAAKILGSNDRFEGFRILELGPLEGAHTYQLEQLGAAEILAIESNKEAYLKCLIVKELAGMTRSKFVLGDFVSFLEENQKPFDMIFCSGVLYHMADPLRLIHLVGKNTSRCFVWTHYYDEARCPGYKCVPRRFEDIEADHYVVEYGNSEHAQFWGGLRPTSAWLKKDDIFRAFQHAGLGRINVTGEDAGHKHGPSMTFTAQS